MRRFSMLLFLVMVFVTGCATAHKMNNIGLGMTKEKVISILGRPVSVSATHGTEYLNYRFSETSDHAFYGVTTPYFCTPK